MKLNYRFCLIVFFVLGCQADPSAHKLPVPDKEFVDKSGTLSTYNPEVDILFIIDDSGSMSDYQTRLGLNSMLFIDQFFKAKFVDYHIGVTTSTERGSIFGSGSKASGGKLHRVGGHRYVDRNTPDGDMLLSEMLDVGISGDGTEKFLSIPRLTFSKAAMKGHNKGFYRPNAHLMIFILTDTYDQSLTSAPRAYEYLLKLKGGDASKLHFAGAIVTIEKEDCTGELGSEKLEKLRGFANLFQRRGSTFNICQDDYGEELARVAKNVVNAVSTVYLDDLPDISSMRVFYGEEEIPNQETGGWTYDYTLNAIHLSPDIDVLSGAGKKLSIRYEEIYKPVEVESD